MTATPSQQRETLAALTAQVRCDLEQDHPDTDITDETISLVLELGGPRMKAAAWDEGYRDHGENLKKVQGRMDGPIAHNPYREAGD